MKYITFSIENSHRYILRSERLNISLPLFQKQFNAVIGVLSFLIIKLATTSTIFSFSATFTAYNNTLKKSKIRTLVLKGITSYFSSFHERSFGSGVQMNANLPYSAYNARFIGQSTDFSGKYVRRWQNIIRVFAR